VVDFSQFFVSGERAVLLESENLFMKLRIQQLEFELETEKIRSRHFEGISEIAMLELKRGNWVSSNAKRNKVVDTLVQIEWIKKEMLNSLQKLEAAVDSVKNVLN
jgi:hypothetical protein